MIISHEISSYRHQVWKQRDGRHVGWHWISNKGRQVACTLYCRRRGDERPADRAHSRSHILRARRSVVELLRRGGQDFSERQIGCADLEQERTELVGVAEND